MSSLNINYLIKVFIISFFFLISCAIETSFWPFVTEIIPPPQIWLLFIIILSFKWPPHFSIYFIYFLGLLATGFTAAPLKMIWFSSLIVFFYVRFFKNRIHTASLFYLCILILTASFVYHISYLLISVWLEPRSTSILFFNRLAVIGCNFAFSLPFIKLFNFLDDSFFPTETMVSKSSSLSPAFTESSQSEF